MACGGCGKKEEEDLGKEIWYGCDRRSCQQWYHKKCMMEEDIEMAEKSVKPRKKGEKQISWHCAMCRVLKK